MTETTSWAERILRVTDHVQAHLDEPLDPIALAEIASFSLHHFHRVFRGMTGESVMSFVRRLRLERAAQRLKFDGSSVTEVAFATGYGSHEAFTRAFRSRFGVSPSAYRERERQELTAGTFFMRDEPARTCLSLRHTGPYEQCARAWDQIYAWAAQHAPAAMGAESLGLCYDDPDVTDAAHLRYDACLVMPPSLDGGALSEGVVRREIPGGRYAVARHDGPYEEIFSTYVSLIGRWLPTRSLELVNEPVVEIYLNSPGDTAPADLQTHVCVRVA